MFMLDKPEFLHWLAEPVKNKLLLNTKLEEIKDRGYLLEMVTSQHTYKTQLAVLANGANYKFQKDLGLVKKDVELVPCIGGFFENKTLHHNTAYFFYDADLHVASWIFPKEDNIFNAGAGMMLKNEKTENLNLKQAFKQSMEKLEITLKGEPTFGGRYVTSGPIGRTYRDRILVCGDAAGQVFAGIGEGIYFSLKAGQLAGQTAVRAVKNDMLNSEFLKEYEVNWNHSFGRQLDAGIILATDLFFLMNHRLTHNALKIIESKEIGDIWFNGKASFRLKLLYYFLKLIGCSLGR
jgi:flavin-dependent dehydrogenase